MDVGKLKNTRVTFKLAGMEGNLLLGARQQVAAPWAYPCINLSL